MFLQENNEPDLAALPPPTMGSGVAMGMTSSMSLNSLPNPQVSRQQIILNTICLSEI